MAIRTQFCVECFATYEIDDQKGRIKRGLCKPCGALLKTFSELKPIEKFITAWYRFGIGGLDPMWARNGGEQRFDETRRKFDFSWPDFKVAVEVDGYGPGHLNLGQINRDHAKVNDAAVLGWTVLRYTSAQFSQAGVEKAVEQAVAILSKLIEMRDKNESLMSDPDNPVFEFEAK
jgi:hypothetical protein